MLFADATITAESHTTSAAHEAAQPTGDNRDGRVSR
jgi:hypothetical protein